MIAVTGANGQLDHSVITALQKKIHASNIVAAVRNVEKARDIDEFCVQVRYAGYVPGNWYTRATSCCNNLVT